MQIPYGALVVTVIAFALLVYYLLGPDPPEDD